MALPTFQWGGNTGQIKSPATVERERRVAEALMANKGIAQNPWEGLSQVTGAYTGSVLQDRADEAEAEGRKKAGALFADMSLSQDPNAIIAALTSPDAQWASDAQTSIGSALLTRGLERADPAYQMDLRLKQAQLDAANAPAQPDYPADVQEYNFYADQTRAAGQEPLPYLEFVNAQKGNGLSIVTNPDGTTSIQQGGPAKALTEGQSKDVLYATRAMNAMPTLDTYETSLLSLGENLAGNAGVFKNYMQSEEYQLARDAGKEFLASILRKDTGAAVTPSEEQLYGEVFLPQPGNPPAVIEAKRQRRALAVEAIKAGMPPQALLNMGSALTAAPNPLAGNPTPQATPNAAPLPITNDAEYEALPPGTTFQAPDGTIRVKQ